MIEQQFCGRLFVSQFAILDIFEDLRRSSIRLHGFRDGHGLRDSICLRNRIWNGRRFGLRLGRKGFPCRLGALHDLGASRLRNSLLHRCAAPGLDFRLHDT